MATKPRDGEATRAGILAAAQAQFGEQGFERTTIRSVAAAAAVDPALVMHYFGNKDPGAFLSVSGAGVLATSKHQKQAQQLGLPGW